uniref:Uncharacterized protein n=1 Tax=Solanum lycopersicum TaxID=4081 RepID=A0A3Q7I5Z3_SOLLC
MKKLLRDSLMEVENPELPSNRLIIRKQADTAKIVHYFDVEDSVDAVEIFWLNFEEHLYKRKSNN